MSGCFHRSVCISETWLNVWISTLYNIKGYDLSEKQRSETRDWRVGIYLKEFIYFMNRDDLILPKYKFESVFIDVSKGIFRKSKHFIIGVIDRPTDKDLKLLKQNMADLIVNLNKMTINIAIWWATIK